MPTVTGKNPCDICKYGDDRDCDNCIMEILQFSDDKCHNTDCFCNSKDGCRLQFDDYCKASTCYNEITFKEY